MMLKTILYSSVLLASCTAQDAKNFSSTNDDVPTYKKTLNMKVNGHPRRGTMVVPKTVHYKIELKLDDRMELIKLMTCHREIPVEKEGWRSRKEHTFEFDLQPDMEGDGFCPIYIGAFDVQGQHASGMIEITNETLPAVVKCNGTKENNVGVSLCRSRVGLLQQISFQQKVLVDSYIGNCPEVVTEDEKTFLVPLLEGVCSHVFYGTESKNYHRLTTFGYTDILLHVIKPSNQSSGSRHGRRN